MVRAVPDISSQPAAPPAGGIPISTQPELADLLAHKEWDDESLTRVEIPVVDSHIVSIGGGLGSLALVDFLRIAGLETAKIAVLSNLKAPDESFSALAQTSQIRLDDRLRSDSSSRIDNIWGWPGYALCEAFRERTLKPLWQVITEPLLSEYFTPRVRTVLAGVDREAKRIGWAEMLVHCWVEVVRRRQAGGYFVLVRLLDGDNSRLVAYRSHHVHLALGHPGPRLLPDLLAFRAEHDDQRLANAYEDHEHIYQQLVATPGRVVLRGSGIAASHVLERLARDREQNGARTDIVHIFRHYVHGSSGPPWFRRPGGRGFAYQAFSFPRAAGGGQLRQRTLALSGQERADLITSIGGTTTARRRGWQRLLSRARRQKWYRAVEGEITAIRQSSAGQLAITIAHPSATECREDTAIEADFLIDATGLEDRILRHPLLADLVEKGGATLNAMGRLDVEDTFEVIGTRSGEGRMYASGAATLGCALGPVDSFWGLIHAAMEICDDLAEHGVCEFPNAFRSAVQWWRWLRNQPP